MTYNDFVKRLDLEKHGDKMMIITDGTGWCNVDKIEITDTTIYLFNDKSASPFSSDK